MAAASLLAILYSNGCAPSLALARRNDVSITGGGLSDSVETPVPPCVYGGCAGVSTSSAPVITAEYTRTLVQPHDTRLKLLAGVAASRAPGVHGFPNADGATRQYALVTVVPVAVFRADFVGMWEFQGGFGVARYNVGSSRLASEPPSWWTRAAQVAFNVGFNCFPALSVVGGARSTWTGNRPGASEPAGAFGRQLIDFHAGIRLHF